MKIVCISNKGNDLFSYAITKNRIYYIVEEGIEHPTGFIKIVDDYNELNWFPRKLFKTLIEYRKNKIKRLKLTL